MKQIRWTQLMIIVSLVIGVCGASLLYAQGQPAAAPAQQTPVYVAVIDLAQVMKQHPQYTEKNNEIQQKVQVAEAAFVAKKKTLDDEAKKLSDGTLKPNAPDFQAKSDMLAKQYNELELEFKLKQRDLQIESATAMYELYRDIKTEVGTFAAQSHIAQVVDYRKIDVNPQADPQAVFEEMDQKVLWFHQNADITEKIINQCYARQKMQRPQASAATATSTFNTGSGIR